MRTFKLFAIAALLVCAAAAAQETVVGTVCRMNRSVDRLILSTDDHQRLRVAVTSNADLGDLRPGDHVSATGTMSPDHFDATAIQWRPTAADTIGDALFGSSRTVVGRFASREAKTEYFSLNTGGAHYIRVDAKSAYGPHGRVRAGDLRSGDLLELDGDWKSRSELRAKYINVITDEEATSCRREQRDKDAEKKFLAGN